MPLAPVHDFRLSWREAPCSTPYAPSVLGRSVPESSLIRTSHPSGSRLRGYPWRGDTRPLARSSPRKSSVPWPVQVVAVGEDRFTDLWLTASGGVQPRVGSGQGRLSQTLCSTAGGWDETAAESDLMVISQPRGELTVSARKPQVFMQTPCSRRTAPGRAECNNMPVPACAPPS